ASRGGGVGAVGGGDDDDALVRLEAVHLDEQLVQRLLALVVTAAQTCAAVTPDRVDLVDEDDAGSILLALLEQIAHAARADADEHFNKVRTRNREEGNIRFASHRPRQQGLARARRANQQHALWDASAELLKFLRLAQKFNDLPQFFFRL